jgi:hypothetical protein
VAALLEAFTGRDHQRGHVLERVVSTPTPRHSTRHA